MVVSPAKSTQATESVWRPLPASKLEMANKGVTEAIDPDTCEVRDLRQFLRDRGDFISGSKRELVQRVGV